MADTVRQLKITGDAASAYNGMKGGGTRRKRRVQAAGGAPSPSNAPPPPAASTNQNVKNARIMINAVGKAMKGGGEPPAQAPQTMPGTTPQNPANSNSPAVKAQVEAGTQPNVLPKTMGGGGQTRKAGAGVVLGPKKAKASKVVLAPPSGRGKTRSVTKTRKIRVQLSGLKKRITKQHTIAKDSREKPISEVRRLLEEAKLIKPVQEGKKGPPDSVLRDIYKDYLLLRNRAL